MIVGSVGTGIALGMAGAILTWVGGHHPALVFVSYAVFGSIGTLCVAALMARDPVQAR